MTTYSKYYKQPYPVGNNFNKKEQKLIEAAQAGIGDEATLRLALARADAGDLIVLAPCTITLTSQLTVTKPVVIRGTSSGVGGTKITGAISSELISINLDAHSTAAEVAFENIQFLHGTDDTDGIAVDNTNAAAALTVRLTNCIVSVFDAAAAAFAIDVAHTTAGQAIKLIVCGRGTETCDSINFAVKNAGDLIECHNMKLQAQGKASAIITSSDAVAGKVQLYTCEVPATAGVTGGNAAQLLLSMRSWSRTGTTYAAASGSTDYTGTQTETVV